MKVYIVRVYREQLGENREFAGIVEQVGVEGKISFTTYEQLCAILNPAAEKRTEESVPENGSY